MVWTCKERQWIYWTMDGTARQEEQWKTTDKICGLSEGGDGVTGEEASDREKWRQMICYGNT